MLKTTLMKKTMLTACLLACFGVATATAQTYYDITELYLTNAAFDTSYDHERSDKGNADGEMLTPAGWRKNFSVTTNATGVYQFGTPFTFNGATVPAKGDDGTAQGGCLALSTEKSQALRFQQSVELPAGNYMIVTAVYNCSNKTTGTYMTGWLPTGKSAVLSAMSSFESGKWLRDTVRFELTETASGRVQVGYKAGAGSSDNSAKIVVDYVKLLRDTPIGAVDADLLRPALLKAVADAKSEYGDGTGNEAEAFGKAIAAAEATADAADATPFQILDATAQLAEATEAYLWANPTGVVPKVVTNPLYARGATMAFGRLTATGGTITEKGFCWSENPEPTISDRRTTTKFTNNGDIYKIENLTPATRYYMRAYAITAGRQVGYGDIIKFYTIPKGQITFSMRGDGGDAAATARIKAAAQTAIDYWNNLTEMKGFSSSIGYNSGTPTAECSYGGWMSVGPNQSYQRPGTIMHELLHGVGVIPWADTEWSRHNLRSGVNGDGYGTGQWLGERTTNVIRFLENSKTAMLNGDYQHMWPYGINGANEDTGAEGLYIGNGLVCQALGEDGLQHTSTCFAEPYYAFDQEDDIKYYIKNEDEGHGLLTAYLMPNKSGRLVWRDMTAAEAAQNDSAAWHITFTPKNQHYQFRNAATGKYMTYSSNGTNGITTATRTTPGANDNFHLMRGRQDVTMGSSATKLRGYWFIHPTDNWTPPCLVAGNNGTVTAATFDIANSATAQRWLILTQEEVNAAEEAVVGAITKSLADAIDRGRKMFDTPHKENATGTDQLFAATLDSQAAVIDHSAEQTPSEAMAAVTGGLKAVQQATLEFLSNVTATDPEQPFDLTYMIKNPRMTATDGWSEAPTLNYSCAEYYQQTFHFYQQIADLPLGDYKAAVQAFQRPGKASEVYAPYTEGTAKVTADFYLGAVTNKVQIAHICSDAQAKKLGGKEVLAATSLYIPDDMQAASKYFAKGLYDNSVTYRKEKEGTLRIGLRSTAMSSSYWVIFDNFRLYFFGDLQNDTVGIADIESRTTTTRNAVYDLQGRRVNPVAPRKGIYIVGGKKVVMP